MKGPGSLITHTLNGSFESDVSVILKVTLKMGWEDDQHHQLKAQDDVERLF